MFKRSVMMSVLRNSWPVARAMALLAALLAVSACGWLVGEDGIFRDRSGDYRHARLTPPLEIPDGLDQEAIEGSFGVPPIEDESQLQDEFVVPRPEALSRTPEQELVRIQRLGDEQWILVATSPGQLWPRLRGFLNINQIGVTRADAVAGILETAWLEPANEALLPERYRFRIDQGVQRGNSEIYVVQADRRAGDDWPEHSSNKERESLMTQELAQFLANSALAGSVSMLAQRAIDSEGKVFLRRDDERAPYLELFLQYERAWASLGLALEKAGFEMDDRNRSQGQYWVRIDPNKKDLAEEEEKRGWWRSFIGFFSWGGDDDGEGELVSYVVTLREQSPRILQITIARQDGAATPVGEADNLLKRIKRSIN